jgi:tyrosine-protein kinase Etk/Wzc
MELWQLIRRLSAGIVRRRKRLVVLTFTAAFLLLIPAAYYFSRERPRYGVSATILIEATPDRVPIFQEFSPVRPLPVQLAILYSRSLAEAVLENLKPASIDDLIQNPYYTDYLLHLTNAYRRLTGAPPEEKNTKERTLSELQNGRVRMQLRGPHGIVEITAEASKPAVASDIVSTYVETLLSRTRSFNVDDSRLSREFLEQQASEVRQRLGTSEEALRAYTVQQGGIRIPDQSQAAVTRLGQTESALAEVEANRKLIQTRLQAMRQKLEEEKRNPPPVASAPPPAEATPAPILRLREQLTKLEQTLLDLQVQYTEAHPRVVMVKNRIGDIQRQLGDELKGTAQVTPDPAVVPPSERADFAEQVLTLETAYHTVVAQEEALRKQAEGLRLSLGGLSRSELEFSRLVREVEANRNLFALLSDRLTAARIREQGEMRVVKVIDPPGRPRPTTGDRRMWFGAAALLLTGALALVVPGAVEWSRRPVETEADVERTTGLPVVGLIPRLRSGRPLFVSAEESDGVRHRARALRETMMFSETFRMLRVALELSGRGHRLKTVLVTSPFPGEGKSTVLVNLGLAFREAGRRVLLADTDFYRPTLHRLLQVPDGVGLVDALQGRPEATPSLTPVGEGMWLAPRGASMPGRTRGLLATKRLQELIDALTERADLVLCDSSPVLVVPDTLFVASAVDGVLIVANSGKTACQDLARTKAVLESAGARVLGVVINEIPVSALKRYYRRYSAYLGLAPA